MQTFHLTAVVRLNIVLSTNNFSQIDIIDQNILYLLLSHCRLCHLGHLVLLLNDLRDGLKSLDTHGVVQALLNDLAMITGCW